MKEKVAILGASKNHQRYSYLAFKMLQEYGHQPFPVNPGISDVDGVPVTAKLSDLAKEKIDTVTLYVNPETLEKNLDEILKVKPRRVIFNPGTESHEIKAKLEAAGIQALNACTLVLLRTNQFEDS